MRESACHAPARPCQLMGGAGEAQARRKVPNAPSISFKGADEKEKLVFLSPGSPSAGNSEDEVKGAPLAPGPPHVGLALLGSGQVGAQPGAEGTVGRSRHPPGSPRRSARCPWPVGAQRPSGFSRGDWKTRGHSRLRPNEAGAVSLPHARRRDMFVPAAPSRKWLRGFFCDFPPRPCSQGPLVSGLPAPGCQTPQEKGFAAASLSSRQCTHTSIYSHTRLSTHTHIYLLTHSIYTHTCGGTGGLR